jgi:integrase
MAKLIPHDLKRRGAPPGVRLRGLFNARLRRIAKTRGGLSEEECNANIRGCQSSLAGLRFHDLRHHAITELAESQASDQTIMSIAGHVSPKRLAHYSLVRMAAKRKALDALACADPVENNVTKHDTNTLRIARAHPQVI